jgi:catechol 2,3-dioxygenase-like lactoylglutathione lyase family enzyme
MKIEHLAMNIRDAEGMAHWYKEHLGMPIWLERHEPIYVAFIGEPPSLLEIYDNPAGPALDPAQLQAMTLHLAFYSEHVQEDRVRLEDAGAAWLEGESDDEGHGLVMMRCPWGLTIQLCNRREAICDRPAS